MGREWFARLAFRLSWLFPTFLVLSRCLCVVTLLAPLDA